jgi:hypothetical protein
MIGVRFPSPAFLRKPFKTLCGKGFNNYSALTLSKRLGKLVSVWGKYWGKSTAFYPNQFMSLLDTKPKARKGTVQIKVSNDRLQLVFSYSGKRHYISLGIPDSKANRKAAEAKAKLIESDIALDRFDLTLTRYKLQKSDVSTVTPNFTPSLGDL